MRSSKIIKSVLFVAVLVACSAVMSFLLCPLTTLKQRFIIYHNEKQNIDFLVLGNSLEQNGIDIDVLSDEMNMHAYKFCQAGTSAEMAYDLLVDITHKHKVSELLLGWDIIQNYAVPRYDFPHKERFYREFLADLKGNSELTKIVFDGFMGERYTSSFFEWSAYPENVLKIPEVIASKKKTTEEILSQKNFADPLAGDDDVPTQKKSSSAKRSVDVNDIEYSAFKFHKVIDVPYETKMQESDKYYILKIKNYCEKHNIKFNMISCPILNIVMQNVPTLNECISDSYKFMKENGIAYIHGNDQNVFPDSMIESNFTDCFGHLNSSYNARYTKYLCDWIKSENKTNEQ